MLARDKNEAVTAHLHNTNLLPVLYMCAINGTKTYVLFTALLPGLLCTVSLAEVCAVNSTYVLVTISRSVHVRDFIISVRARKITTFVAYLPCIRMLNYIVSNSN